MLSLLLFSVLAQPPACPDYEQPALVWSTDTPPQIIVLCNWHADGCPQGHISFITLDTGFPDIDGLPRSGIKAVCTRIADVPPPVVVACGNGIVDPLEECDDGNLLDGDGCSAVCVSEPPPCPTTGPAQAIQDPLTEDLVISCAPSAENCPAFVVSTTVDGSTVRARCRTTP